MIRVVELFAGVGGFRLGLERASEEFVTIWANQWEPNKKKQWAYECYKSHWDDNTCVNKDINLIDKSSIPDFDLLVGGNPCQNWSVASSSDKALGLEGSKGILWFQIYEILKLKKPKYFLLENVDRQLKAPTKQRGRDFSLMLSLYNQLGYEIEYMVVDSSKFGNPQRRKRVFVFGCKDNNPLILRKSFPFNSSTSSNLESIKEAVNKNTDFKNYGYTVRGCINASKIEEIEESVLPLGNILERESLSKRYLTQEQIEKFKYLKGSKRLKRITKEGYEYTYSEGAMSFPDNLNFPSRTMLTSEGSVNRCTHVIDDDGLRFLTPVECERLNGFPDNWTKGMPERMRYFCMGNALVVPLITRIGKELIKTEERE